MDDVDDVNLQAFDKSTLEPANKLTTAIPTQLFADKTSYSEQPVDAVPNATPLKLEVSASEDESSDEASSEKIKVVKNLNLSSTSDTTSDSNNQRVHSTATTTKRANKMPRRNSSDDFVLGFNEQSGEVELLKKKSKHLHSPSDKSAPKQNLNSSDEQLSAPTAAKRIKKSSTPTRELSASPISLNATVGNTKSPEIESNGDHSVEKQATESEQSKQHIVGDSEDNVTKIDYGKPFRHGWKRELVWRVNSSGRDKADIYFISPAGKKLRSRNEIQPLLKGDLRIEDFSFAKEPLGISPEHELVRHAKPLVRTTQLNATSPTPSTPTMGKRVSKPKVPKGASPPPEGWTPTRALKLNNNALSSSTSSKHSPSIGSTSISSHRSSTHSTSSQKSKKPRKLSHEIQANNTQNKIKSTSVSTTNNVAHNDVKRKDSSSDGQSAAKEATAHEKKSTVQMTPGGNVEIKFPQTIAVVKGKKYVMVSKAIATSTTDPSDSIQSDLRQIKEGIRNIKKPAAQLHSEAALFASLSAYNSSTQFAANFFGNVSSGYNALLCILKYLKIHERSRAALVCKIWNLASKDTTFWQTVRMKNSKVCDWAGFATALRRGETKHLDLRKMLLPSSRSEDIWQNFCEQIGTVSTLEIIDMCRCSAHVIESLFQTNKNLRVLNALAINDTSIDLQHIEQLTKLEELRLRPCDYGKLKTGLTPLQTLTSLKHLSLTGIRNLGTQGIDILGGLLNLQSLELGECGQFDTFASNVLPKLQQLQRLRLENNQSCCTLEILEAVKLLPQLTQLELVNFDIKPGFDLKLCDCVNVQKLLIIPTYISQSATTNNIVLSAVQKLSKTLKVFTWGVTVELLRVTALYVDQCEGSTKKEKQHFDECIPVLKPVPGAIASEQNDDADDIKMDEDDNEGGGDVPQIEIIPLDKVEMILANNLPQTKFTIVKIPYHATCKQQLVD